MSMRLIGTDIRELFFVEARGQAPDVWLAEHGWTVTGSRAGDLAREYGRALTDDVLSVMGEIELLRAGPVG